LKPAPKALIGTGDLLFSCWNWGLVRRYCGGLGPERVRMPRRVPFHEWPP